MEKEILTQCLYDVIKSKNTITCGKLPK